MGEIRIVFDGPPAQVAMRAAERHAERKIAEEEAREEELANGQFGVGA